MLMWNKDTDKEGLSKAEEKKAKLKKIKLKKSKQSGSNKPFRVEEIQR